MSMSKLIKLYTFNIPGLLYVTYTYIKLLKMYFNAFLYFMYKNIYEY